MRIHVLLLTICLLTACTRVTVFGHTLKHDVAPPAPSAVATGNEPATQQKLATQTVQPKVTRITLVLTAAAQRQAADDMRFDVEALRKAITDELVSRQLLDQRSETASPVAVIQVDEFTVKATTNVVLFGSLPSVGVLGGSVQIRDAAGAALREFHVRADLPLRISQRETESNPLRNLYKGFAALVADDLAVKAARP
jgi:hypothetical protein